MFILSCLCLRAISSFFSACFRYILFLRVSAGANLSPWMHFSAIAIFTGLVSWKGDLGKEKKREKEKDFFFLGGNLEFSVLGSFALWFFLFVIDFDIFFL